MQIDWIFFYIGLFVLGRFIANGLYGLYATFFRPRKDLTKFGKWAIVTGATDGIGKALAMEIAKQQMNLFLISRTQTKLDAMKKHVMQIYPNVQVRVLALDCSKMNAQARAAIKAIVDEIQDIGVLINNVGVCYDAPKYLMEVPDDLIDKHIQVNVAATIWMTKLVIAGMAERKRGAIVNISSGSSLLPMPFLSVYAATKAFVNQFSRCIGAEYVHTGVTVQCQTPLFITTKLSTFTKTSFFVSSAETYAKYSVARIGYENTCNPYWSHMLQIFGSYFLPEQAIAKVQYISPTAYIT